jgi:type II secretory ATPase GspE/PulE/Tfp pilus assembly ATPase PilB-like protein
MTKREIYRDGVQLRGAIAGWLTPGRSRVLYEEIDSVSSTDREVWLELIDGTTERLRHRDTEAAREMVARLNQVLHPAGDWLPRVATVSGLREATLEVMARPGWLPSALWELLLLGSSRLGVTDLHLERNETGARLSIRLDGLVHPLLDVNESSAERLVNRLKVMADLVVYRADRPQEGRAAASWGGHSVSARVTTAPGLGGEQVSVRLHDPNKARMQLEELGLDATAVACLDRAARLQRGVLVVAGPPSGGKSTTLFSIVRRVQAHRGQRGRIVSLEDPVEVELPGVAQIQVDEARGNTYAALLKVVLRQDADVIAIGEIRDRHTAELVIQAGLSGHLVLSTVHAGSVGEALVRIRDLGLDPSSLNSAMQAVVAQQLVRRPCGECDGAGCAVCEMTGFRGRHATGRAVLLTDAHRRALAAGATAEELELLVGAPEVPATLQAIEGGAC